jgi:small multidrug resistance pump
MFVNSWFLLSLAIFFEILGTVSLKLSYGFSKLTFSVSTFVFYGISFFLLSLSLKKIDLSIAYAIWSGVGTMMMAIIGIAIFNEAHSLIKVISILLVVAGVIGLKLA